MSLGNNVAWQKRRHIERYGTDVTLPDGRTVKAVIHEGDHELIRGLRAEEDAPEKRPSVFVFASDAWGVVLESTKLTLCDKVTVKDKHDKEQVVDMSRHYRVTAPLHPHRVGNQIVELAVVAFPE